MDQATRYCADIARGRDYDRYLCALFAPEAARAAIFAVLAFNAEIGRTVDVVSEPMLGAIRLQWWRQALDGAFAGKPERQPLIEALAGAVARFQLPRAPFERILAGCEAALDDRPIADLAALTALLDDGDGSVGELTLAILGVADDEARQACAAVARAWGLARLLLALPRMAARGRLPLPHDRLAASGLTPEQALERRGRPGLRLVVAGLVGEGRQWLRQARSARARLPRAALPALLPATVADGYFSRLARFKYDAFEPRVDLPPLSRQLRLAWKASLRRF